jgi:hypothetical protein
MKKGQLPIFAELTLADIEDSTVKAPRKFTGTDNPRMLRAIHRLLLGPATREQLDKDAGCSNSPDLIANLRKLGLGMHGLPCTMVPVRDRDGLVVRRGVYSFSAAGRRAVIAGLAEQYAKSQAAKRAPMELVRIIASMPPMPPDFMMPPDSVMSAALVWEGA